MAWPVTLSLSITAYPLNVVQRAAYSLAETLAIQVNVELEHIDIVIFPAQANLTLSEGQARALTLQHLNDFALRNHINLETAGLREALVRAALSGCELSQ